MPNNQFSSSEFVDATKEMSASKITSFSNVWFEISLFGKVSPVKKNVANKPQMAFFGEFLIDAASL